MEYKVYKIIHIPTGRVCYIGSTCKSFKERYHNHCKDRCRPMYEVIHKYGRENFKLVLIDTAFTQQEIFEKEKFWTKFWRARTSLFNIDDGKERNTVVKARLSAIGHTKTGEANSFYGHTHTEEAKGKMREKKLGRKLSREHVEKIRSKNIGKHPIYKTSTKVLCVNTGEVFMSYTTAGRAYGVSPANIQMCCKKQRSSAGKLNGQKMLWMFA